MRNWVDRNVRLVGGLLLPPRCLLCGACGQPPVLDLCHACEAALAPAPQPLRAGPSPLRWSFAPFAYCQPLAHLVHALKYRGQLAAGRVLGTLLGARVVAAGMQDGIDVIVPVPLHPRRHAERGFNQSAEIARWVAHRLGRRVEAKLVLRRRATRPQVGLHGADRTRNMAGAFAAGAGVRGLHVAIVDDVLTTGSTVYSLCETLHDASAASVIAWSVARADHPKRLDLRPAPEDPRP